jgi:uncharacterized protein
MPPAYRPQRRAPHPPERARRRARAAIHTSRDSVPPAVARISLWRTPRARSLLALGVLAVVVTIVALAARVHTDLLWFHELSQERVLWTTLKWRILARGVPGFGTACLALLNFAIAERVLARHAPLRPHGLLAYPAAALAAGVVSAAWWADGAWRLLALWSGRGAFGARDPLFDRDVGYFVFSLPFYQQAARWELATVAIAAAATVAAYLAAGRLRPARAHLLTLAALALVVVAWRYRLEQFALALPHEGSVVPGASYTDVHVRLPARRALVVLSVAGAALCLYAARRRVPRAPAVLVVALAAVAVAAEGALPAVIERLDVEPQQLSRERPYLADAIGGTRGAFGLADVRVRRLAAADRLSAAAIAANRRTIDNVPVWDNTVLRPTLNDLEAIGRTTASRPAPSIATWSTASRG